MLTVVSDGKTVVRGPGSRWINRPGMTFSLYDNDTVTHIQHVWQLILAKKQPHLEGAEASTRRPLRFPIGSWNEGIHELTQEGIMSDITWFMQGKWLEYCSCDHGCPCESMAPPTRGHCDGVIGMKIDEGYYGDVRLNGLVIAATFYFPRAIHHGDGHMQPILEERTTEAQREAIFKILSGEGQPVGTMFQIFSVIVDHLHDPLFLPIEFAWDIHKRTARLAVPDVAMATTVPIRNPVTDKEERIRTVLPGGWNFYEAEVASGTAKGIGDMKFDFAQRHSSLAYFAFDNNGMAFSYEEAKRRFPLDT